MNSQALLGLSALLGLLAYGLVAGVYLWPRLRILPRNEGLAILTILHTFRYVGLGFLVQGVVSPSLPRAFAAPTAYGDLIALVLAVAATIAFARRWSWSIPVVWLMNLWGTADILFAFYNGGRVGLEPGMLGATFFLITGVVPLLLVTHFLSFRLLLIRPGSR